MTCAARLRACHRRARGFTLVEVLLTLSIASILLAIVMPSVATTIASARERGVVEKFTQDYDWVRGRAGTATVTLTLAADCSWTTSINGSVDADHSMALANLSANGIGIGCTFGNGLPAQFAFSSQGFATPTGALAFTGTHGQRWSLQVLYSGSLVRTAGAS